MHRQGRSRAKSAGKKWRVMQIIGQGHFCMVVSVSSWTLFTDPYVISTSLLDGLSPLLRQSRCIQPANSCTSNWPIRPCNKHMRCFRGTWRSRDSTVQRRLPSIVILFGSLHRRQIICTIGSKAGRLVALFFRPEQNAFPARWLPVDFCLKRPYLGDAMELRRW